MDYPIDDEDLSIFVIECEEHLTVLEQALLTLETDPGNSDLINAAFRPMHTIKGAAGILGIEPVVEFTHVAENILDQMRDFFIPATPETVSLLFRSKDYVEQLVTCAQERKEISADMKQEEETLLNELNALHDGDKFTLTESSSDAEEAVERPEKTQEILGDEFTISIQLGPDTFKMGFSPALIFEELTDLGELLSIEFLDLRLPDFTALDAESCYLGWIIHLKGDTTQADIATVLEFISLVDGAIINILPARKQLSELQQSVEDLPEDVDKPTGEAQVKERAASGNLIETTQKKQLIGQEKQTDLIRIESEKLDYLINQVGELITQTNAVNFRIEELGSDDFLNQLSGRVSHTLDQIRTSSLDLRMLTIGTTFNRFNRVVRDLSRELNKKVTLVINGAETKLDKSIIEKLSDPLMHIVRNSLDHGLEGAEERIAHGKSEKGTISLNAFHDSGNIIIEVSDDGRGLNTQRIREKALEKGLMSDSDSLSDYEINNLIFTPGFSTTEQVSNTSGRGVGMDVVRRNIESLRGSIELVSTAGKGTCIRIQLPLTLAIIRGFHVRIDDDFYVIPMEHITECFTLSAGQRRALEKSDTIKLRDRALPIIRLGHELGSHSDLTRKPRLDALVIHHNDQRVGLVIDELRGEVQAVIKPLTRFFDYLQDFSGFSNMSNGEPALIINISSLINKINLKERRRAKTSKPGSPTLAQNS